MNKKVGMEWYLRADGSRVGKSISAVCLLHVLVSSECDGTIPVDMRVLFPHLAVGVSICTVVLVLTMA